MSIVAVYSTLKSMSRNKIRIGVAMLVASIASLFTYAEFLRSQRHSDFGHVWFAARSLLHGIDPYPLIGPGKAFNWDWPLYYPATSMAAVLPLGLLPELVATLTFVWISAGLMTYALSKNGWERIWILPSAAFIVAARAAQWSPIYCAAYLMPPLAWMLSAKPTLGLAVVTGVGSLRTIKYATAGFIVLVIVSLALLPSWPAEWMKAVSHDVGMRPAFTWPFGAFVLLAALRWRLPEARLLFVMGCVPTTASWYEALPLLLVGRTKRECQALSLISSVGYVLQGAFLTTQGFVEPRHTRPLMLAFCYLPALFVVLRRPSTSRSSNSGAIANDALTSVARAAAGNIQG